MKEQKIKEKHHQLLYFNELMWISMGGEGGLLEIMEGLFGEQLRLYNSLEQVQECVAGNPQKRFLVLTTARLLNDVAKRLKLFFNVCPRFFVLCSSNEVLKSCKNHHLQYHQSIIAFTNFLQLPQLIRKQQVQLVTKPFSVIYKENIKFVWVYSDEQTRQQAILHKKALKWNENIEIIEADLNSFDKLIWQGELLTSLFIFAIYVNAKFVAWISKNQDSYQQPWIRQYLPKMEEETILLLILEERHLKDCKHIHQKEVIQLIKQLVLK